MRVPASSRVKSLGAGRTLQMKQHVPGFVRESGRGEPFGQCCEQRDAAYPAAAWQDSGSTGGGHRKPFILQRIS
jgi:hypothetical protein